MAKTRKHQSKLDPATEAFTQGAQLLSQMTLFAPMQYRYNIRRDKGNLCPEDGWAVVTRNGVIHVHPARRGEPEEWVYLLAHCLLHLGFDHFREQADDQHFGQWNMACDIYIARFLAQLKIGRPPADIENDINSLPAGSEDAILRQLRNGKMSDHWQSCGTTGAQGADMIMEPLIQQPSWRQTPDWPALLGKGIAQAVTEALANTSHVKLDRDGKPAHRSVAEQARQWFVAAYPLLGALAAGFKIIEDVKLCQSMSISVAAVHAELQEIYINPAAGLSLAEMRFVMAHELLHVGLRHEARVQGRDHFLWNVACDYVINSWLLEMGVGEIPSIGMLYDEELKGLSAEAIYDRIVTDLRKYRRLSTLRGKGMGDILPGSRSGWWTVGEGVRLDDFYRNALTQGLEYHQGQGRGLLPAGLIEEIRALNHPPVPWDVQLARWFDLYFPAIEKRRSYARPSRRQSSTPDIPRPHWVTPEEAAEGRTFGVVLDTSGSMSRLLLAKALGAIASYATARDVPMARVVFCDATYYDQGYMPPEAIADRVRVRGRGGTILQPAITFLERVDDFPKDGPLLIITDGYCDPITVQAPRPHAYLIPKGNRLPFQPRGDLFYIE